MLAKQSATNCSAYLILVGEMPDPQEVSPQVAPGGQQKSSRWRMLVIFGGAIAGLAAFAHISEILSKVVDAYDRSLQLISPYCDGRPITELRAVIRSNLSDQFYSAARNRAQKLLECKKEDLEALNQLGAVEFYTGNFVQAEIYFRRAIKPKPDSLFANLNLADTLVELGKYDGALDIYKRFDDGTESLLYKIARANLLASNFSEARRLLVQVSSDFGEEARPGQARILEAAALLGLARQANGSAADELRSAARQKFLEGMNKERAWWVEIVTGKMHNRYEPFEKVVQMSGMPVQEWIKDNP
jgi:tetratricopeptide (TPR) repeat protein